MNDLQWLNSLSDEQAASELKSCCGSTRWAAEVGSRRPYDSLKQLLDTAEQVWWQLTSDDWLEAFRSHPKIGQKTVEGSASVRSKEWSRGEQAGMDTASEESESALARLNEEYESRFGYIFIVCATGKSSEEMLAILRERLQNGPDEELRIAAGEQAKITEIRLKKLIAH